MREANLTFAALAEQTGVQRGTVDAWVTGRTLPKSIDRLPTIARAVGVERDELIAAWVSDGEVRRHLARVDKEWGMRTDPQSGHSIRNVDLVHGLLDRVLTLQEASLGVISEIVARIEESTGR